MNLLFWNIRQGGGTRASRIIAAITAHDPDVIALAEFRAKPGAIVSAAVREKGWPHFQSTNQQRNTNGLCILSKTPLRCASSRLAPPEYAERWLDVGIPEHGFSIGLIHIMNAGRNGIEKERFWGAVLEQAAVRKEEPFIFIGDFNTGAHRRDEVGKTFHCAEHFIKLSTLGWTDLWRHHNSDLTEYTWYSKLKGGTPGNGFRIDHAFATPSLLPRVNQCWYSHAEREAGTSDHSMLIVQID